MYDRASSRDTNRMNSMIKNTVRLQPNFFKVPLVEWSGVPASHRLFGCGWERAQPLGPRLYKSAAPNCPGAAHELDLLSYFRLG
jgi:hypothetical protein